jgi:hypothetical protein
MIMQKTEIQIQPANMVCNSPAAFMKPWFARLDDPIEEALHAPGLFALVRERLLPGDTVMLGNYGHRKSDRLVESARLIIVAVTDDDVDFTMIGTIVKIPPASESPAEAA